MNSPVLRSSWLRHFPHGNLPDLDPPGGNSGYGNKCSPQYPDFELTDSLLLRMQGLLGVDQIADKLRDKTPEPPSAIKWRTIMTEDNIKECAS